MNFRVTALLLACAGAADSFRMAKSAANSKPRIFRTRISRVTGGKSSVLYSDGERQWTIDGSHLKHFEFDDLLKRGFEELDDGTLLFSPEYGLTGEPSFLYSFAPGADTIYVLGGDRPRGGVSTGECTSFSSEVERILNVRQQLAAKGIRAHIVLVDVFAWNVDEHSRDGGKSPSPRRLRRA